MLHFFVEILGVCSDALNDILRDYNYAERQILEDNGSLLFQENSNKT